MDQCLYAVSIAKLLKLWSHQISWGTSSCDPVRSHKLNRLGQLKLWCCQISSAKQVWDKSLLEQETCNEQVGFEGHSGCDNTMYVHDVPFSFVNALISGRNSALPIRHTAERQYLWKRVGWNWDTFPDFSVNKEIGKDLCFVCAYAKSFPERNQGRSISERNGWVWSKPCLDNDVYAVFTLKIASSPVVLPIRLNAAA